MAVLVFEDGTEKEVAHNVAAEIYQIKQGAKPKKPAHAAYAAKVKDVRFPAPARERTQELRKRGLLNRPNWRNPDCPESFISGHLRAISDIARGYWVVDHHGRPQRPEDGLGLSNKVDWEFARTWGLLEGTGMERKDLA